MAKPKTKGRNATGGPSIDKLEAHYGKMAALLHQTDAQDHALRQRAIKQHDAANKEIAELAPKLEAMLPKTDPAMAERYGQLLDRRRRLAGVITKDRVRQWDTGPSPVV